MRVARSHRIRVAGRFCGGAIAVAGNNSNSAVIFFFQPFAVFTVGEVDGKGKKKGEGLRGRRKGKAGVRWDPRCR